MRTPILAPTGFPARYELGRVKARYEAAYYSKERSTVWSPVANADVDGDRFSRTELIRICRYLHQNFPIMRALIERITTYTVGTGLVPVPISSSKRWNKRVSAAFEGWARRCHLNGRLTFGQYLRMAERAKNVDGESFTILTRDRTGRPRIQLIEAHRVAARVTNDNNDYADGIALDAYGMPVSYAIDTLEKPIPAEKVVHHFRQERSEQNRGISILASAVNNARDIHDILRLEKMAVKAHSAVVDIIKTPSGEADLDDLWSVPGDGTAGGTSTTERAQYYRQEFGAETKILKTGDEYDRTASERPTSAFQGFIDFLANTICISAGLPPSVMLGIKIGGADTRRDMAIAARTIEIFQSDLIQEAHRIWEYWAQAEIDSGWLDGAPKDWNRVKWHVPKDPTCDSGREAQQDRADVRMGIVTLSEYLGRWNDGTAEDHLATLASEADLVRKSDPSGELYRRLYAPETTPPASIGGDSSAEESDELQTLDVGSEADA